MQFHDFDNAYVERLRDADPETERHFIEYFTPLLRLRLRRRADSPQRIDDIRQETFLRTFRAIRSGGLRQPSGLGAFVLRMGDNVAYEMNRRESRVQPIPEGAPEAPESRPGAEADLITEERKDMVRDVLKGLKQQDRSLLRAIFFDERDKDEVCRELGVDRDYLRVLLHRAKGQFKREFLRRAAAG
ncbi:MAG: sigma-70 family RNA polymerase sigma factor [Acidobacteria bacterium]|nr:sigma-70 family RNA polymerase sigma factor [Acidobacteriota bacterium]